MTKPRKRKKNSLVVPNKKSDLKQVSHLTEDENSTTSMDSLDGSTGEAGSVVEPSTSVCGELACASSLSKNNLCGDLPNSKVDDSSFFP